MFYYQLSSYYLILRKVYFYYTLLIEMRCYRHAWIHSFFYVNVSFIDFVASSTLMADRLFSFFFGSWDDNHSSVWNRHYLPYMYIALTTMDIFSVEYDICFHGKTLFDTNRKFPPPSLISVAFIVLSIESTGYLTISLQPLFFLMRLRCTGK